MTVLFALVALVWVAALFGARSAERDPKQRLEWLEKSITAEIDAVIPARNEERNLRGILESLLEQSLKPSRIVVVDDRSDDWTPKIADELAARDGRVKRIDGEGPPPGWTGKTAALVAGVKATTAPWLLFVDADVRLDPHNLQSAVRACEERGWDGLSLLGRWEVPSFRARLLQSVIGGFVRGAHPIPRVNDPSRPDAFLNGQYLLIRRAAYDLLGGWEAVKSQVLEDVAFAKRAKKRGVRIGLLRAPRLMTVVPYRSAREVWDGYLKNFVAGAGGSVRALLAAFVIAICSVLPFVVVAVDLALGIAGPRTIAAGAACVAAILYRVATARMFHHPPIDAIFHPIANAWFVALILAAVLRRARGAPATWKGRRIDDALSTRDDAPPAPIPPKATASAGDGANPDGTNAARTTRD